MTILIVYESMWGNTREIAEAIGRGLGADTPVLDVAEAPAVLPPDVDLLVVGGPTHALSMSRDSTRKGAANEGATPGHSALGIREWLGGQGASNELEIATFDTRVAAARRLPGSAAKAASKSVKRHHLGRVVASESFYVDDKSGPLLDGELDRARGWGLTLAAARAAPGRKPR